MSPYAAALGARFRTLLQYRAAAAAGIVTQVFFGFVRIALVEALYATGVEAPMSLHEARGYVWMGQAFLMLGMMGVDAEIAALVRSGNVTADLVRPLDLHGWWLARVIAGRAAPTCLRALPILALAGLLGHLGLPRDAAAAALFAVSVVLALLLGRSTRW